jgi:hypothetical protein
MTPARVEDRQSMEKRFRTPVQRRPRASDRGPGETVANLTWGACDVYVCGDPECRSKVLVLDPPRKLPHHIELPRCVCGNILEAGGTVLAIVKQEPCLPDLREERE